ILKDSVIAIEVENPFVTSNLGNFLKVDLVFAQGIPVTCGFYNKKGNPGYRPRLVLVYDAGAQPGEWLQAHANAQHTRQLDREFKLNLLASCTAKKLGDFRDVRQDILVYKGSIYVMAQDNQNRINLMVVDPNTLGVTTVLENLSQPSMNSAVDPKGWM